jgi:DNA-binding transcriptional MocR family regulator
VGLLAPGFDGVDIARRAAAENVEVMPLARHARAPLERDGLQIGFAAVPTQEIARGLEVLARALESAARR